MGLGESVANGCLFAMNNPEGLFGGLKQSVFISLANIIPGVVLGKKVCRDLNHVDEKKRKRAKLWVDTSAILAAIYNFGVAHYRESFIQNPSGAFTRTIPEIAANPFNLSLPSIVLGLLGFSVFAIATYKGYTDDDVYPGYGDVDRDLKNAKEKYNFKLKEVLKKVEEIPRKALVIYDAKINELSDSVRRFKAVIDCGRNVVDRFQVAVVQINKDTNTFLKRYRTENIAIRKAPAPKYFSEFPDRFTAKIDDTKWLEEGSVDSNVKKMESRIMELHENAPSFGRKMLEIASSNPEELNKKLAEIKGSARDLARKEASEFAA